ncbi:endosomal/lysosomal potassium channel TMEM175-like [Acropora millepora]|uniref:endosomal/lysosomal potassium channel TMEM175-like n=1 Tax=Acropora millepora TaxID=45264 RepID=UPI0010FC769D|nr:endosomal/lysosomal potassium channel TMEM175-like [Acropora millepora]
MAEANVDLFDLKRLQCFNDAVFAIVATILVLPLRRLEEKGKHGASLADQLSGKWRELVVYVSGFLVICAVWKLHVLRFRILSRVDDVLVWFNLTSLLFTSLLPFTCALEGRFTDKYLPLMLVCGNLLILEILEFFMIIYAFHHKRLLDEEFEHLTAPEIRQRMKLMLVKKAINPFLYISAGALSLAELQIGLVIINLVIIAPCISPLVGYIYCKLSRLRLTNNEFDRIFGNFIENERVEFFSDGIFAIVSTLLVLDITAEHFPSDSQVRRQGIQQTLLDMKSDLFSYGATFVVVALLWFTHHSLFHRLEKINQVMVICNNVSLAFVGLSPLINVTLNHYVGHGTPSGRLAVQCGAVILFLASITQVIVLCIALWKGSSYLKRRAEPHLSPRPHWYLVIKLSIIPAMTFLVFISVTLCPNISFADNVYHICAGLTPLIFIVMKIVFSCCLDGRISCCQRAPVFDLQDNIAEFSSDFYNALEDD